MNVSVQTSSTIAARVSPVDAGGPAPGRIQLFPAGSFAARDGRPGTLKGVKATAWTLTPDIAAAVIARWQARETPLVVDYEHQTMLAEQNGKPAPAAGWIESLELAEDGLYAAVKWTPTARAYIESDEYRYISPVFSFDPETGAVLELKSAALTNYPALDGMDAVKAREEDATPMKKELADRLCKLLGLNADATEEAMLTELSKLPDGKGLVVALSEKDTEIASLKSADPDPAKFVPAAMLTAAQAKTAALTAKVAELEKTSGAAAIGAEIDAALADGRLPKSCEAWARGMANVNPDAIRAYMGAASPLVALTTTQTGGTPPAGNPTSALTDEEKYAARAAGISETDFIAAKAKECK